MRADPTERDGPAGRPKPAEIYDAPVADDGARSRLLSALALAAAAAAGWCLAILTAPAFGTADAGAGLALALTLLWWVAVLAVVRSDLRDFIIPDEASAAIALLGLAEAFAVPRLAGQDWTDAVTSGAGAMACGIAGFGSFWLLGALFRRYGTREALGFGDVKLAGASAIWLSAADAAVALEVAALAAIAALVVLRLRDRSAALRETAVPFGAFMAPAAWLVFVLGPAIRDGAGPATW